MSAQEHGGLMSPYDDIWNLQVRKGAGPAYRPVSWAGWVWRFFHTLTEHHSRSRTIKGANSSSHPSVAPPWGGRGPAAQPRRRGNQ